MKHARRVLYIVLIAVFAFSAFKIGRTYYNYNKADTAYEEIQDAYVSPNTEPFIPEETVNEDPQQAIQQAVPSEPPITIDFPSLLERNSDVIGWLYCPDTVVNYPVVQGQDNDQYLHRDLDGKYLVSGTLFADYRNGPLEQRSNYIIYGHNMKNGTMFSMLTKYKNQAYYDDHPIMYYLTPDGNYRFELFAGLVVQQDDKIYMPNQSQEEFSVLLSQCRAKSTFLSDVELEYDDTIVTLSTCSYESDNARYIVIGRLIPV